MTRLAAPGLAVAALVAVLGSAGCSEPDRLAEVERGIAAVLADRLERSPAAIAVACPADADLEDGSSLTCDVAVERGSPRGVAFTIDDGGVVRLASAVIPTDAAEDYLAGELATPAAGEVTVTCGQEPLLVHDVGGTFACDAVRASDGSAFTVAVEVTAIDGTVRYQVAPAPGATTTTTTTAVPPP